MTFGELVRERRIARELFSRGQLADRCSSLAIADVEDPIGDDRIGRIEEGAAPRDGEVEVLAAALFDADDPERVLFIELARVAQRYEAARAHQQETLNAMLHEVAGLIGGRIPRRASPKLHEIRAHLGDVLERMAETGLVEHATLEIERGPRLELIAAEREYDLLDLTIRNTGMNGATDVALLFPGSPPKRGVRPVVPGESVEFAVRTPQTTADGSAIVQYSDPSRTIYLQRLEKPASRVAIRSRVLERPKTWWDVNHFIVERLEQQWFRYELTGMDAPVNIDSEPDVEAILNDVRPSDAYAAAGFVRLAPTGMKENNVSEVAFMSPELNDALWHNARIAGAEDPGSLTALEQRMRANASLLADVLRAKYAGLRSEQRFFNEAKTCLGSDLTTAADRVTVFRGTYFHGFLTNELATKQISTREAHPAPRFRGSVDSGFLEPRSTRLAGIAASGASNHIGASVILLTGDRRIQFWRQSGGEVAVGKAAATGSGSCDWEDWADLGAGERDLAEMARRAMLRELREESGLMGRLLRQEDIQCRLLGYFRWVRRGGKPEFVGLARTAVASDQLWPDVTEVDAPTDRPHFIDASNRDTLEAGIDRALARSDTLSLPLWTALTCLRARCADEDCRQFLWG
ncbi:MAG TPA: hypothetical protein VGD01_03645 [Candidatus Elarobacter sp.]|jgi:hypothetical protein